MTAMSSRASRARPKTKMRHEEQKQRDGHEVLHGDTSVEPFPYAFLLTTLNPSSYALAAYPGFSVDSIRFCKLLCILVAVFRWDLFVGIQQW